MANEWTPRERVMAVLSGEKPDRAPIFECVAHDGVLEHFSGRPVAVGDAEAVMRACARFLDILHPLLVPQAPGRIAHADGSVQVRERWNTWTIQPPLSDSERSRRLAGEIEAAEAWRPRADARRRQAVAGTMVYIHVGYGCQILPFDLEQGFYLWADEPELARRWNRAQNERARRNLESQPDLDAGPVCIIWNDIAAKNGLLYPPELLEELFYPHLRSVVEWLHNRGLKVLFHSDGDVTKALGRLADCGIDGFNPLEISAGMTPEGFRSACGRRVALVGGIDAVELLARGTPAQVAAAARRLLDLFRADGNLIVASASGQIDNSMPTENVLALYETVWSCGRY